MRAEVRRPGTVRRWFLAVAGVASLLGGCAGGTQAAAEPAPVVSAPSASAPSTPVSAAAPTPDAGARVCCESFGYGARMVECCFKDVWSSQDECKVPPGFVGGGRRVVSDDKCAGTP
jgi:hypothetical protein